jgi:hypothetical protein
MHGPLHAFETENDVWEIPEPSRAAVTSEDTTATSKRAQEAAVLSQVEAVRSMVGYVPRPQRLTDAVWGWLETHWNTVSAILSVSVAAVLLATGKVPPLLVPFVLGPLGAVIVTALIAPKRGKRPGSDTAAPVSAQRRI